MCIHFSTEYIQYPIGQTHSLITKAVSYSPLCCLWRWWPEEASFPPQCGRFWWLGEATYHTLAQEWQLIWPKNVGKLLHCSCVRKENPTYTSDLI